MCHQVIFDHLLNPLTGFLLLLKKVFFYMCAGFLLLLKKVFFYMCAKYTL
jgi:hypothetical protein